MTPAQQAAVDHFAAKLRFETDPSDVLASLEAGEALSFVDVRSEVAWRQGRAVGAIHLPRQDVAARALEAGFIVNPVTPERLRLAPPLTITHEEIAPFLAALPGLLRPED